ncbi:MAG: NRDE family protein [Gammaproteobacteria bacterium]|nr:NRDE family protein [Gammaproteobacteria bacterium]MBV9697735.1 NRDE family protein [Gammaproteobacteria bacterium]
MCLLVLAWQAHPRYRLVVAANRDEFHARAAAPLARWADADLLAGRDLSAGGTWLGLDRARRFGVITNFRDLQPTPAGAPSRGELVPRFLGGPDAPGPFCAALAARATAYAGFNLLLANASSLWYASNRATPFARALPPGIHGISNEHLDAPWPKLVRVRAGFAAWLARAAAPAEELLAVLADRTASDAPAGPAGLDPEWQRVLSAPFVLHPQYGTRCSTVLLLEPSGQLLLIERRFDAAGAVRGEQRYALAPGEWPQAEP